MTENALINGDDIKDQIGKLDDRLTALEDDSSEEPSLSIKKATAKYEVLSNIPIINLVTLGYKLNANDDYSQGSFVDNNDSTFTINTDYFEVTGSLLIERAKTDSNLTISLIRRDQNTNLTNIFKVLKVPIESNLVKQDKEIVNIGTHVISSFPIGSYFYMQVESDNNNLFLAENDNNQNENPLILTDLNIVTGSVTKSIKP